MKYFLMLSLDVKHSVLTKVHAVHKFSFMTIHEFSFMTWINTFLSQSYVFCYVSGKLHIYYLVILTKIWVVYFANTTLLWAKCCPMCLIPIVNLFLIHWSWLRVVPFTWAGIRPYDVCDWSTGDAYSPRTPDSISDISWDPCLPRFQICICYRTYGIDDCSLFVLLQIQIWLDFMNLRLFFTCFQSKSISDFHIYRS
jgi:hypothetical protein